MDAEFWLERWRADQIGFHESKPNGLLVGHIDRLGLASGDRIFLPLCGKTLDIGWLLAQGYTVCGVELSRKAVEELFAELRVEAEIRPQGDMTRFHADRLDVFVGDIFDLSREMLGAVDAVYDRAALIALPEGMRQGYAAQLRQITAAAPQLLICLEYDQRLMDGPPFSIRRDDVVALYGDTYRITRLAGGEVPDGLKGRLPATEVAWLLEKA